MDWTLFLIFLASCGAAAATGTMFQPGEWYRSLEKPLWTPPDRLFPIAWTTLYLCMSLAAMRVAMRDFNDTALALWGLQLALNTLWSPIFFGLNRMGAAFAVICCLWLAVAATLLSFWAVDVWSGVLFVPYLAWVTIAGGLNLSVWRMNPEPA